MFVLFQYTHGNKGKSECNLAVWQNATAYQRNMEALDKLAGAKIYAKAEYNDTTEKTGYAMICLFIKSEQE